MIETRTSLPGKSITNGINDKEPNSAEDACFRQWLLTLTEQLNAAMIFGVGNLASVTLPVSTDQFRLLLECMKRNSDGRKQCPDYSYVPHPDPANSTKLLKSTYKLHCLTQCKEVLGSPSLPLNPTRTFILSNGAFIAQRQPAPHTLREGSGSNKSFGPTEYSTVMAVLTETPLTIEWLPDVWPVSGTGMVRVLYPYVSYASG